MNELTYVVVAEYPSSMWEVGDEIVVLRSSHTAYITEVGDISEKYDLRDFPEIFKLVE
jgi:hypothetical protein